MSTNEYEVQYKPSGKHANADGLSWLPLNNTEKDDKDDVDVVCALEEQQLNCLSDIQKATVQDPILSQVYSYTCNGWPESCKSLPDNIKPFFNKRFQLTVNNKCLLWGIHVLVPDKFHSDVLQMLHEGHPGMTK